MAEASHSDSSISWLTFFFVCFVLVMSIGAFAIVFYDANAPEPKPGGGGHGGMILPANKEYAPHARIWPLA